MGEFQEAVLQYNFTDPDSTKYASSYAFKHVAKVYIAAAKKKEAEQQAGGKAAPKRKLREPYEESDADKSEGETEDSEASASVSAEPTRRAPHRRVRGAGPSESQPGAEVQAQPLASAPATTVDTRAAAVQMLLSLAKSRPVRATAGTHPKRRA